MPALTLRDALLRGKRRPRRFGAGSPTMYRGDGYEFVELRAYVPGDDVRRIDWAATARAGELQTRVVLEDVALTLAVLIDDSDSMRVGRERSLLAAAQEAAHAWFATARGGDRLLRVGSDHVGAPHLPVATRFEIGSALTTARAALRRGTALLAIGDWYELDDRHDDLLANLGAWCDCTALIARDPWYDALPLGGFVRFSGAEGGTLRAYVGKRERAAFAAAVRAREAQIAQRFERAGWRAGALLESDGVASLRAAFGVGA
ncbi:MAG TPA: DUF58 domain-containing protein [Candidatus Acidoferrales bacterium]|nr:DUF58 domain-containing protein [Candidatus Acidoferrales bacterium]